jgi:hypothetical protein
MLLSFFSLCICYCSVLCLLLLSSSCVVLFSSLHNSTLLFFSLHSLHFSYAPIVATPLWPSVGVKPNTPKVGDLESSGTPECLEFDSKAQNTSHWGVLGVIGKVLKRRYRKCPRIGHLDICSPSYGQKKGRESNWQFDSRSLKVGNQPAPDVRWGSATRRWKDLNEGYNIGSDLVPIRGRGEELWLFKVPGVQPGHIRDNFGTPFRESREKVTFGCHSRGRTQSIL